MAIELCHVAPTKYLRIVDEFCKFHLVNGALIGIDKEYTDFFINSNKYKILNNGFPEGKSLQIKDLIIAAEMIHANEIICPEDPYYDASGLTEFLKICDGRFKVMVVPHGLSTEEWHGNLAFFKILGKMNKIHSVGLSASVLADAYKEITGMNTTYPNRLEVLKYRKFRDDIALLKWEVHLLGLASRGGREIMESSLRPEITRCSTSAAFQAADEGGTIMYSDLEFARIPKPVDYGKELDQSIVLRLKAGCHALNDLSRGLAMNEV